MAAILSGSAAAQPRDGPGDLADLLARVGARVEQYYARARTIVCNESVVLQPLARNLTSDGPARRLIYEWHVEWEPPSVGDLFPEGSADSPGTIVRELVSIDGHPPRPQDKRGCMDPRAVSLEPLAMLLPGRSGEYALAWAGTAAAGGRPSVRLDYRLIAGAPPAIEWNEDCVSVDLRSRARGRVWIDAATDEVLRIDEHLVGPVEIPVPTNRNRRNTPLLMTIERADSSTQYRTVTFSDPDETWLVPSSIESMTVIRNAGVPRLLTRQVFSNCRRFTTAGRIVK